MFNSISTEVSVKGDEVKWKNKYPSFVIKIIRIKVKKISDEFEIPYCCKSHKHIIIEGFDGERFSGVIPNYLVDLIVVDCLYKIWHHGCEIKGVCRKDLAL